MAKVTPGYMGYAGIGSYKVRCTDFNVKLKQDILFYDHIIGLRDSIPTDIFDSKGDVGAFNEQKIFWRPGTKIVEGSVNFPMTSDSSNAFFEEAYSGNDFDVDLYYSCDVGYSFTGCKVNTYSWSATSGEAVNVSIGVIGKGVESIGSPVIYNKPEKIITWDAVKISGTGGDDGLVSFEFSINNNCIPIYTSGTNNDTTNPLLPHAIRVGMQSVTGSISFYDDALLENIFAEEATARDITISAGTFSAKLKVLYLYPERQGQVSAYIKTVAFVGIENAVQA